MKLNWSNINHEISITTTITTIQTLAIISNMAAQALLGLKKNFASRLGYAMFSAAFAPWDGPPPATLGLCGY